MASRSNCSFYYDPLHSIPESRAEAGSGGCWMSEASPCDLTYVFDSSFSSCETVNTYSISPLILYLYRISIES
jgi:hypothetical protein